MRERKAIYELLLEDPSNLIPMPGVFELLDALGARELSPGIASTSPRNQVDTVLLGLQIVARFRAVVAGDNALPTKPAPDVYLRATEEQGIATARCLEDNVTGITAAKAAGLYAIAVPNRYTAHQDLTRADARVENLGEVVTLMR